MTYPNFVTIDATDRAKLNAFLRTKGVTLRVVGGELTEVVEHIRTFCEATGIRIELIDPSGMRIALFTSAGVLIGATYGYLVATIPGALIGAAIGAIVGSTVAHHRVTLGKQGDTLFLSL